MKIGIKNEVGQTYGALSDKTMQRINRHKIREYAKATKSSSK